MKYWNQSETEALQEMWLAGVDIHKIAKKLGRNTESLKGKISRLKLNRKHGKGLMFNEKHEAEIRKAIDTTFRDVFGRQRIYLKAHVHQKPDQIRAILLAMLADGRESQRIQKLVQVDQDLVDAVDNELSEQKLWIKGPVPDPLWWNKGYQGLRDLADHLINKIN